MSRLQGGRWTTYLLYLLLFALANIDKRRVQPYVYVIVKENLKSLHY